MTRAVITPQLIHDFLEVHAIGADAPGGAGVVRDQSIDRDHSEVRIDGTYDLSEIARELNTIDQTDTLPGVSLGMRRLIIVAAIFWFGYWLIALVVAYREYQRDYIAGQQGSFVFPTADRMIDIGIYAVGFPVLAIIAFFAVRWIVRGYRADRDA